MTFKECYLFVVDLLTVMVLDISTPFCAFVVVEIFTFPSRINCGGY